MHVFGLLSRSVAWEPTMNAWKMTIPAARGVICIRELWSTASTRTVAATVSLGAKRARVLSSVSTTTSAGTVMATPEENVRMMQLVQAYKDYGHLVSNLDPLRLTQLDPLRAPYLRQDAPMLQAETYGLQLSEIKGKCFWVGDALQPLLDGGDGWHSYTSVMGALNRAYCGNIGSQFAHLTRINDKAWVERRVLEHVDFRWSNKERRSRLEQIANASYFEEYYGVRLSGAKRFSLEGCEALIPGIKALLGRSAELGIQSIEMGMTHRGRLNVLRNILNTSLGALMHNFQAYLPDDEEHPSNSDDVRYHLGTSVVQHFEGGERLRLSLAANPSHLESVNSVVLGKTRARQFLIRGNTSEEAFDCANLHLNNVPKQRLNGKLPPSSFSSSSGRRRGSVDYSPSDWARASVMGLLLHGDASFFQGSVREVLGFSGLRDYATGGTIHIILNNQIGFTTLPKESHSGVYCSDVAMSIGAPIFHVNADDPDAVAMVCRTAVDYRQAFQRDCVVNLWCYRRHGHNEQDDPKLTQPLMYSRVEQHPKLVDLYAKTLLQEGVVSEPEVDSLKQRIWAGFKEHDDDENAITAAGQFLNEFGALSGASSAEVSKKKKLKKQLLKTITTGVEVELLRVYGQAMFTLPPPQQFAAHPKVADIYDQRLASVQVDGDKTLRWATAEALAFASLLADGFHVRLSGQDVERGTFNQRHAVLLDQQRAVHGNEATYKPWTALQCLEDTMEEVQNNMVKQAVTSHSSKAATSAESEIDDSMDSFNLREEDEEEEDEGGGVNAGHYFFPSVREKDNDHERPRDDEIVDYPEIDITLQQIQAGIKRRHMQRIDSQRVLRWRQPSSVKRVDNHSETGMLSKELRSHGSSGSSCAQLELEFGNMEVCNSPLSEEAVLGFEHGYSLYSPNIMTVFEHQFGDFSNCAQTVIDTFVASGEDKWVRSSGMVILCPHGYEGQGPDHSSARVERFLQLCSEPSTPMGEFPDELSLERVALCMVNMHVLNMTTPAQYFHALRRHMLLPIRKPLVIFTPKYLLHHKPCASTLDDLGPGHTFETVLLDTHAMQRPERVKRVILCSGKIWYHLAHKRRSSGLQDQVALLRVEQLCPFPFLSIKQALLPFLQQESQDPVELIWVQEEPQNMGCWTYVEPRLRAVLNNISMKGLLSDANERALKDQWGKSSVRYCGRPYAASPATGSFQVHQREMAAITTAALTLD